VKKIIAVINPTKKDITTAILYGAEFEDSYNLLKGVGKDYRNLKFKKESDINKDNVSYYIQHALKLYAE
jgi:hypothetical protein